MMKMIRSGKLSLEKLVGKTIALKESLKELENLFRRIHIPQAQSIGRVSKKCYIDGRFIIYQIGMI